METIRAFIAIELPETIQQALQKVITRLSVQTRAVHWVPVPNIHLTLKFLGDSSSSTLALLQKALQAETLQHAPCEFSVEGIGAFPGVRRPRVIWVGVRAPVELELLEKGVDHATRRLGFAGEERPFSPHLTLGRVNQRVSPEEILQLGDQLSKLQIGVLGTARVHSVTLFRSDLRPSGAVYSRLYESRLKVER
jgi:2'-5' RNA ligase